MKLHELQRELAALASVGLRDADVEVTILELTKRGIVMHKVISTDRGAGQTPTVVLTAVPYDAFTIEEDG